MKQQSSDQECNSLRERKRRQTLASIEEHATRLVAAHGFNAVTVDDICQAVQISKRTFFNYVESKEQAVLGAPPQKPTGDQREAFLSTQHENLFKVLLALSLDNLVGQDTSTPDKRSEIIRRRKKIRRENPELDHQASTLITAYFTAIQDLATEYFTRYPQSCSLGEDSDPSREAETLALVITSAIRGGYNRWISNSGGDNKNLKTKCNEALDDILTMTHPKNSRKEQ